MTAWTNDWNTRLNGHYTELMTSIARGFNVPEIQFMKEFGGRSGATTCLGWVPAIADSGTLLVFKFFRGEASGKSEMASTTKALPRFLEANHQLGGLFKQATGECCVAMKLVGAGQGRTLKELYNESTTTPGQLEQIISGLFEDTLQCMKQHVYELDAKNVFEEYAIEPSCKEGIESLDPKKNSGNILDWWKKSQLVWAGRTYTCFLHGDLHSENVIVGEQGTPYVIDFGRSKVQHIMSDFAKLERDIRLVLPECNPPHPDALEIFNQDLEAAIAEDKDPEDAQVNKAYQAIRCIRDLAKKRGKQIGLDLAKKGGEQVGLDWEFEYQAALLAQYLFLAGDGRPQRTKSQRSAALELARALRDRIDGSMKDAVLWRVAYSFLRLDQIPKSGWAKSLPHWIKGALGHRQAQELLERTDVRKAGGVDLTGCAFSHYVEFFDDHLRHHLGKHLHLSGPRGVAGGVRNHMASRIGFGGGIDVRGFLLDEPPMVRLQHTLVGTISFLLFTRFMGGQADAQQEAKKTLEYLEGNLNEWRREGSRVFGIYAALIKINELFDMEIIPDLIDRRPQSPFLEAIRDIEGHLLTLADEYPFFHPREELRRSDFLLHFPFFLSIERNGGKYQLSRYVQNERLRERFANCFANILDDIETPFDPKQPADSLINYFPTPRATPTPTPLATPTPTPVRDWGISAEAAALLVTPGVRELFERYQSPISEPLAVKLKSLHSALRYIFHRYHESPELFKRTHGVSFSRYLGLVGREQFSFERFQELEQKIEEVYNRGVTERDLWGLHKWILEQVFRASKCDIRPVAKTRQARMAASLKDLFMDKLESGEHAQAAPEWGDQRSGAKRTTAQFFNEPLGIQNAEANNERLIHTFTSRIVDFVKWIPALGKPVKWIPALGEPIVDLEKSEMISELKQGRVPGAVAEALRVGESGNIEVKKIEKAEAPPHWQLNVRNDTFAVAAIPNGRAKHGRLVIHRKDERPRSLDVGCGGGAYAVELARMGFDVDLLDISEKMLEAAGREMRKNGVHGHIRRTFRSDVCDWINGQQEAIYDIVFASAVVIHIPREDLKGLLEGFYRILKPEGLLFINLKVNDHTLISLDDRFFEYYRDYSEPLAMLKSAKFRIEETVLREKTRNMYGTPQHSGWANFYCIKRTGLS